MNKSRLFHRGAHSYYMTFLKKKKNSPVINNKPKCVIVMEDIKQIHIVLVIKTIECL